MDSPLGYIRSRIANACDGCKARKVKCDGKLPCSYCSGRRRPQTCHYSPQRRRKPRQSPHQPSPSTLTTVHTSPVADEDTEVPREARLVCDAQGKLVFIGDCAPLSFFQSVRQVVTTRVGQHAFAPETSGFSALENVPHARMGHGVPDLRGVDVQLAVRNYLCATTGLVDLFDDRLAHRLTGWIAGGDDDDDGGNGDDVESVVNYLVLAIGTLKEDEAQSYEFFEYAREKAYGTLSNLGTGTVQAYMLITIYMLCSCQINGAFLFFGMATRAAYSIGVHRSEVNARFGAEVHVARDKLWKSLRVVDLFLSISMGRPPSASDVDCSVPYRTLDGSGNEVLDLLNASVQILLITERIVVDVFSRKKISLQLTEGISHQLRDWSARWLSRLKDVIAGANEAQACGACQVLASYYYAVMLVSRPFLMYELVRRLGDAPGQTSGKSKLADACIDAASLMVDLTGDCINRGVLGHRLPVLVMWLFASSLVLGVGLLGGFGRILEKEARLGIQALEHFAKTDTHAMQYSLIAKSLLSTAVEDLERREVRDRMRRSENSSQLFGLVREQQEGQGSVQERLGEDEVDAAFLGLSESLMQTPDGRFWDEGALNLFPLLDGGGGIDLAHYF